MTLIKSISGIRGTIGGHAGEGLNPLDIVKFTSAYATLIRKTGNLIRYRHGFYRKRVFLFDIQLIVTSDKTKKGECHTAGCQHKIKDFSFHGYVFF